MLLYSPGTIYTGGSDGRIFAIKDHNLTLISRTGIEHPLCGTFELEPRCGRPKGMKVGPDGHLYIVDAYKGLLKLDLSDFSLHTLINSGKGKTFECMMQTNIVLDRSNLFVFLLSALCNTFL